MRPGKDMAGLFSDLGGLQCHPVSELKGILWFVEGIAFSNMNKNEQTLTIASV
jgi:hypothetical protein